MSGGFNEFGDFAVRVEQCDDLEELWRVTEGFGRSQGFPRFGCAFAEVGRVGSLDTPKVRTNCSEGRVDVWTAGKLYARDPAVQRACSSFAGFCWGVDYLPTKGNDPKLRTFYRELAASAARSMYVVPLPRVARGAFGIGILCNDMSQSEFERHVAERSGLLTLAMIYADRRMIELQGLEKRSEIGLLPREAECLEWLADGLDVAQTAKRMGLSVGMVETNLAAAKRKLRAETREQAIAIALRYRLIRP